MVIDNTMESIAPPEQLDRDGRLANSQTPGDRPQLYWC